MKRAKIIVVGLLIIIAGLMTLTACDINQSPEYVAKAYINATAKIDFNEMIKCTDYRMEFKDIEEKKAGKALFDLNISKLPDEKKAELKTYKFKKYQIAETQNIEIGESGINITEIEMGEVTVTYKKNGKEKETELKMPMVFAKVDRKWYIKMEPLINID